jgi:hypothetical protein
MMRGEFKAPLNDHPGVYIIRCKANNATYTGSSLHVRRRLQLHVSLLRTGSCLVALMQKDWNQYGEDQFEFLMFQKPPHELYYWEELITMLADSLDDCGGFNKMLGNRVWSLSSRIKNSEQKLIKKRKLSPLPSLISNERLTSCYLHSFCQGTMPFIKSEPLLTTTMDPALKQSELQKHLASSVRFDPAKPKRRA